MLSCREDDARDKEHIHCVLHTALDIAGKGEL